MGFDKATLVLDGEPLWRRQLQTLQSTGASEVFVAGKVDGPWSQAGLEAVADAAPDVGPLGGLVAGLRRASHAWLLVLAVDLPDVPATFLSSLIAEAMRSGFGQVPAREEWLQPLAAIYPARSLPVAEAVLATDHRSLRRFFRRSSRAGLVSARAVSNEEQAFFRNLNTPEDLAARVSPS